MKSDRVLESEIESSDIFWNPKRNPLESKTESSHFVWNPNWNRIPTDSKFLESKLESDGSKKESTAIFGIRGHIYDPA